MKSNYIIYIIICFSALIFGVFYSYQKFYPNLINPQQTDQKEIGVNSNKSGIYYQTNLGISVANPDSTIDRLATSPSSALIQNSNAENMIIIGDNIIYDNLDNNQFYTINKTSLSSKIKEIFISNKLNGLESFINFRRPLLLDHDLMIFLAENNVRTDAFSLNLISGNLTNLTSLLSLNKVYDISLSPNKQNLAISGRNGGEYILESIDLQNNNEPVIIKKGSQKIDQINWTKDGIFSLQDNQIDNQATVNLYLNNLVIAESQALTMISAPYKIIRFTVSDDQNLISFEMQNSQTLESDISICRNDGSNLLQLTNDGKSSFPVFSPDNSQIAFMQNNNGLFKINIDKTNLAKILNINNIINQIFIWR